ncbi:hypothetical protein LSUE1_G006509 [Lachnellula suecica]|uniref:Uncharacterized protein n=1 Tax=Lachnellula suecica TaxID=602035 RepID=A0A8T9C4Q8_9HELO|nr:hypothetical protein LSUE1_G006509 [Lachnellula suecica]
MSKFRSPGRTNTGTSIRGKIGPPIPMPDDDEFPIRTPGAGIATPLGDGIAEPLGLRGSTATDYLTHKIGTPPRDSPEPIHDASVPAQSSIEEPFRRAAQPSPLRTSMGTAPSKISSSKPQRKKSSLRSVLGKLFGKKRKSGSTTSNEKEQRASGLRAEQHRSDPTAFNRSPKDAPSPQKRSASLPINEYNRALRSHSTVIEGFPQYGAEEPNRNSIHADGQTRPRRATTPSRLWTPNKAPGYVDWTGLSPRPASSHVRGSKVFTDEEAEAAIGMAVTSGSHPNRRSRSLGQMREAASLPPIARRRSHEIRYWRESYDPGIISPMSSNKPDTEDPIVLQEESEHLVDVEEQPQPFNFGPMGEMAGMKITQAASLETRVQRLEARMQKADKTLSRLHHPNALVLQDPPKRNPNRIHSTSFTRPTTDTSELSLPAHDRNRETNQPKRDSQNPTRSSSQSRPSTVDTNASYQHSLDTFLPPTITSPNVALISSQETARPLSTSTTIRGIPSSSPTMPKDGVLTVEHYTALTNMILGEQAARHKLEVVVRNLQQQLKVYQMSGPGSFPTPDSNEAANPLSEGLPGGEFSNFEQDDDSSDDEGRYGTDAFQTPREERGNFGDDTFGDVMNEEGSPAPRTMSLSQMTLGKGLQRV